MTNRKKHFPLFRWLPLAAGLSLIACGGGPGQASSEGDDTGGQEPDPVVVDFAVAYIARPLPREEEGMEELRAQEILDPAAFNPGARLILKDRATATAASRVLTEGAFAEDPLYDIKHLSAHPDGDRLLFAMRAPELEDVDEEDQPTWNIWEYDLRTDQLRRVITSDISAEAGQDLSPRYLPDDRILFTSTRQTRSRAILLDDNKPQFDALVERDNEPAFLLHVMANDGTEIEQISYNQSHDLQPSLLDDGRILFSRWDGFNNDRLSLYTLKPDGTDLSFHYGYHSLNGEQAPTLFRPEQMPDGRILAIYKPRDEMLAGDMLAVDSANFTEVDVSVTGSGGNAQESLSSRPAQIDGELSLSGLYSSVYHLRDGTERLLASWSQCRLQTPEDGRLVPCTEEWLATEGVQPAEPLFGLWVYNLANQTQQPLVVGEEGVMYTEVLALEPRPSPDYLDPTPANNELAEESTALLHIRSVYDIDGTDSTSGGIATLANPAQTPADQRPARFLRLIKAVSTPSNDVLDEQDDEVFGNRFNQNRGLLEILGYVPIEPDGSVMTRVPADIALSFDILNARGERVGPRHENWLQMRAGEERHCQGCHTDDSQVPHGRPGAEPMAAWAGAPTSGAPFAGTRRTDAFGTPEYPLMGETMAQFDARIAYQCTNPEDPASCVARGPRAPSVNLVFEDVWTDPGQRTPDESFSQLYSALSADRYREWLDPEDPAVGLTLSSLRAPVSDSCQSQWNSQCRTVINYENHIQQLWDRQRLLTAENEAGQLEVVLDDLGAPVDHSCVGCHSNRDADDKARVPLGQLELVSLPSANGQMTSYVELLNNDNEQELIEGSLVDRLVPTGEFQRDEEGELILDEDDQPIPIMVTVTQRASMSRNGAASSQRFFGKFENFDGENPDAVDHRGMLNQHELKLLREWLDTGGRYYNNHFDTAIQE